MPITVTNGAEGLAEDAIPSTGNTGGASGTACSAIDFGAASTIVATEDAAVFGGRGYRFSHAASGTDGANRLRWLLASATRAVVSAYVTPRSTFTATEDLFGVRNGSGAMGQLMAGSDQKIRMWNSVGTGIGAGSGSTGSFGTSVSTQTLAPNVTRLIQIAATKGTTSTNGTLEWAIFDTSGTLLESWSSGANVNVGTTDMASFFMGRSTGRTGAHTIDYDEIRAGAFATGWIDPVGAAPVANAGSDRVGIEPGRIIGLDASGSTTAIGTITGYAWVQTDGPTVTVVNSATATPSYRAPATLFGDTVTFQVTVTNSASLTHTATVTHTILPASLRIMTATGIRPAWTRITT